jgi:hypothetical protein
MQGTQDEEKHNTVCVGHHYAQVNTNNINKKWALLFCNMLIDDGICKATQSMVWEQYSWSRITLSETNSNTKVLTCFCYHSFLW